MLQRGWKTNIGIPVFHITQHLGKGRVRYLWDRLRQWQNIELTAKLAKFTVV